MPDQSPASRTSDKESGPVNNTKRHRVSEWLASWIETLRVAPPFSRRRRELLALLDEPFDDLDWIEMERP